CYAYDATNIRVLPDAVAFPETTEDVRAIVGQCSDAGLPVIPRGAGTGFAGGTVPLKGGMVVSTERLNRILDIDPDLRTATVQPGVVNSSLQKEAAKVGLMFAPDPSSLDTSTIGGNVAQDAGGPRAVKYGVTRDHVLGVEAVLWDGRLVSSGRPHDACRRWNPLLALFVGSEGTLGVITEIIVGLVPRPKAFATALVFFKDLEAAAAAVNTVFASGVLPAAIELMDATTMGAVRKYVDINVPEGSGCALLIETDGWGSEAAEAMAEIEKSLEASEMVGMRSATGDEERAELWKMRRSISPSLSLLAPHKINEDVCVPRSRLPGLAHAVTELARKYSLLVPTFGHAGDGNLHVNVMLDKSDASELRRGEAFVRELFDITLALGGTISGEHGVGITKKEFLPAQLGDLGLELQRCIKKSFDPHLRINPDKVVTGN
ncbi:MAG: FAD-linked oxidase C-terminal domain-containing protein, partial [bacterium]